MLEGCQALEQGGDWLEGGCNPRVRRRFVAWARALDKWARVVVGLWQAFGLARILFHVSLWGF
jgi:hypothetical protein